MPTSFKKNTSLHHQDLSSSNTTPEWSQFWKILFFQKITWGIIKDCAILKFLNKASFILQSQHLHISPKRRCEG